MIRDLCAGQLEGADIGSTEITFTPGKIQGGSHTADTKTAGCVALPSSGIGALALDLGSEAGATHTWQLAEPLPSLRFLSLFFNFFIDDGVTYLSLFPHDPSRPPTQALTLLITHLPWRGRGLWVPWLFMHRSYGCSWNCLRCRG